jgi:hypothetical protein
MRFFEDTKYYGIKRASNLLTEQRTVSVLRVEGRQIRLRLLFLTVSSFHVVANIFNIVS